MNTKKLNSGILYKTECYSIQGAVFDVYNEMGNGFLESVYHECLEEEFTLRAIPFYTQKKLTIRYKSKTLKQTYKPDFICNEKIIIEIKAVKEIAPEHEAQVLNYLKATGLHLGLLVNFGSYPKVTINRYLF
jgi:GxxExxY protein